MAFAIVPAREWQLKGTVEASRRERLLDTPFDSIVQQIASETIVSDFVWENIRKIRGARRIRFELALPPQTVDLFPQWSKRLPCSVLFQHPAWRSSE